MAAVFDPSTERGAGALHHLETDIVAWLTTVTPEGQPQSMPVWFVWDATAGDRGEILVYGDHRAKRNRNLEANPKVSFHIPVAARGGYVVVIEGTVVVDPDYPPVGENERYLAKYGRLIDGMGGPAVFGQTYSMPIRISPTKGLSFPP